MISRLAALSSVCFFAFSLGGLFAQGGSKDKIQVRTLAVTAPDDLGLVFWESADGEFRTEPFGLTTRNVGEPVAVDKRDLLLKMDGKGTKLCAFSLPEAGKSFVVVLIPAKPAGYRAEVIRLDDSAFKKGDVYFVNLSAKAILGQLGTKQIHIPPGKTAIAKPEGDRNKGYYDIFFGTPEGKGAKVISSTRWPIDDQVRSYVFFTQIPGGRITYRAVDEFVAAEKAAGR